MTGRAPIIEQGAVFSPDRVYRYRLDRRWAAGGRVVWVMLNPSDADETRTDPTATRCRNFSEDWGYGAMTIVNPFALVATDPANW